MDKLSPEQACALHDALQLINGVLHDFDDSKAGGSFAAQLGGISLELQYI